MSRRRLPNFKPQRTFEKTALAGSAQPGQQAFNAPVPGPAAEFVDRREGGTDDKSGAIDHDAHPPEFAASRLAVGQKTKVQSSSGFDDDGLHALAPPRARETCRSSNSNASCSREPPVFCTMTCNLANSSRI